jgi:murein tripeptide amidase MpaA
MTYLNVVEVESALSALASNYPAICELITLPNPSIEGRTSHALRIGTAGAGERDGVLLTGGVHAREWGSSEICVYLAADLCEAYTSSSGLIYGGKSFAWTEVKALVEGLNWYVFPDVNPDGRHFSQTVDASWRMNRNPSGACVGVDLNRNNDFLWDFPNKFSPSADVRTSTDPCDGSQTYRGASPASEPETRNVVWVLDTFPRIRWYVDLHSSGELILHSWGNDESQGADASQNFMNPAFDDDRGVDGDGYKEFIPAADFTEMTNLAAAVHDSVQAVRGKDYFVGPAFGLYATSGANDDFAYSRHFTDSTKGKVISYTVEWGTQFQPPWSEMERIIEDISAGMLTLASEATHLTQFVELATPTITFNDVPEGETTARAVVFDVMRMQTSTFQVVSGPTATSGPGGFGTLASDSAVLPATSASVVRQARLWLSHTGTGDGDVTLGTVRLKLVETGEEWEVPISGNTIARPTVGATLVLDQSGSMADASGLAAFPTRNDVLRFAAPTFVHVLQEGNGVGIVGFDSDAYPRMAVQTAGPPSSGIDPVRTTALSIIGAHAPNPAGMTAIGDGVEAAMNMLDATAGTYDEQATIVFTDGHETESKYIADVAPLINDKVFAIGLGTAEQIQPAALSALTNGTGGYLLLTGNLGNDDIFLLSKYYLQVLAGVTNHDIVLDPEGFVQVGQKVRIPFRLNEADISVDVLLMSDAPAHAFEFSVETPAGDEITPVSVTALGGHFVAGTGVSFYRLTLPAAIGKGAHAGKWHAVLGVGKRYEKHAEKNRGLRYSLNVQSYSGIRLRGSALQSSNEPGAKVTVTADLTEYGIPVGEGRAQLRIEIERPDGTNGTLPMFEVDNRFQTEFMTSQPGVYRMRMLAVGKSRRGRLFTREHLLTAATWRGGDRPLPKSRPSLCCKNPRKT